VPKIEFFRHSLGDDEKKSVMACLDGLFLTTGATVATFEDQFARYLEAPFCVALNSCTAALHLALLALDIGPGDEVITTPMTFIATATAILHTGACPVFVDVDPETGLIDPERIVSAITSRTRAILPVHLYGHMCDMKKIAAIALKHDLAIVEDAAHCLEGEREGIRPGQLSDIACFSFYATKSITSGEGGAIVCRERRYAERIRSLRQHGMSREAADRYSETYHHWDMLECGWKYNMDNIQAALLLPQLDGIEAQWLKRKERHEYYEKGLELLSEVRRPRIAANTKHGFHLYTIWVEPDLRDTVLTHLSSHGVGVAVNYRAIHLLTFLKTRFGYSRGIYPGAELIGDSTISLPFYPDIPRHDIDLVIDILGEVLRCPELD